MSDERLLPTPDEIIAPGIDKLVELRPNSRKHINFGFPGTYGKIFVGLRAQVLLALGHLKVLARTARLPFSEGDTLKALLRNEYDLADTFVPTKSVGTITLSRTGLSTGVIPKGTKFHREGDSIFIVPYVSSDYISTQDVYIAANQTSGIVVPVQALSEGSEYNYLQFVSGTYTYPVPTISDKLFDATFVATAVDIGGGSSGTLDEFLRRYATAYFQGQYGATTGSALVGTLRSPGVVSAIMQDDTSTGEIVSFIADSSWGSSSSWCNQTKQFMTDDGWIGNGCRHQIYTVKNRPIAITADVYLRRTDFLSDTTDITDSIGVAVNEYFDLRQDWNIWKAASIRGVISNAHEKILYAQNVQVVDMFTGSNLTEPTALVSPLSGQSATHYYLVSQSSKFSYFSPA